MKMPFIKFYPRDWMGETSLQCLDYDARGLWIEMLCLMATSDRYGYLLFAGKPMTERQLARMTRGEPEKVKQLVGELIEHGVVSRCDETGALFSRRLVKDAQLHDVRSNAIKKRWGKTTLKDQNPDIQNPDIQNPDVVYTNEHTKAHTFVYTKPDTNQSKLASDLSINPPTLADCQTAAATIGMTAQQVEQYFHARNSQGWVKSNGRPITNLRSDMVAWKNREQTFSGQSTDPSYEPGKI